MSSPNKQLLSIVAESQGRFYDNTDLKNWRKLKVRALDDPVIITVCKQEGDLWEVRDAKIKNGAPENADAFCVGKPYHHYPLGIETHFPVQYYQIQKPIWHRVEEVLKGVWDKAANPYVGGELR